MEFLYFLEGIRTPIATAAMSAVTYLGTQYCGLVVALVLLWCVGKRPAYYVFSVSLLGTVASQWLKLVFCIPRPWVLDPDFTIVESARGAAGGYSFPSGHTQFAVGAFGAIAAAFRATWVRVLCLLAIVLVPFSRMYLGVHTPLDVGVAFACAVALVAALWPCFADEERFRARTPAVLGGIVVLAAAFALWVHANPFPADIDADNLAEGMKNAWTMLGCALGLAAAWAVDARWLDFQVKAPLPGQMLKVVLGLALLLGILAVLKPLLAAITGGALWANAVRYFLAVVFAACIWPMSFPFFARIGADGEGEAGRAR